MIKYTESIIKSENSIIYIEMPFFLSYTDEQKLMKNIKEYNDLNKHFVIDMNKIRYSSLGTLSLLIRIHNALISASPTVLINASAALKRMIKNNHIKDLFYFCEDVSEASDYYNNYLFKTMWK